MNYNYQKELEKTIKLCEHTEKKPYLILHSCCAPCSSYVLEYLCRYFKISILFFNPNIYPEAEYDKRLEELKRFIKDFGLDDKINIIGCDYSPDTFFEMAKGLENVSEGGERCFKCYEMRLLKTAQVAKELNADYFTTTLSISPYKNAQKLNEIGKKLSSQTGVKYLYSDFKKNNGYKRSIELSRQYGLYRQDYCGCIYSQQEAHRRQKERIDNENK